MQYLIDSALAEAQLLHSRNLGCEKPSLDGSYFSIFRLTGGRPAQTNYRMLMLDDVVRATAGAEDVYLSQSSFSSASRAIVNLRQVRAAWVDLDFYNIGQELNSATVSDILAHGKSLGIPTPTEIIFSGRGCYVKWLFENPVTPSQLVVWNALQATLTTAYACLAADLNARDAARVLRLIDTQNSKSGKAVQFLDGCRELYDFGGFCKSVEDLRTEMLVETTSRRVTNVSKKIKSLTSALTTAAERGDAAALQLYSQISQPAMLKAMSAKSLNWSRFCDLRDVYTARGGIPVGERDKALFWMLNFLGHSGVIHSSRWDAEINQLLGAFPCCETFNPINDGSMQTLFRRLRDKEAGKKYQWRGMDVDPMYRPSNDFLIHAFDIKPAEMTGLSSLISLEIKRVRQDVKVEGRADRRIQRDSWRKDVEDAFKSYKTDEKETGIVTPLKVADLARYVGIERTRVSRYLSKLSNPTEKIKRSKVPAPPPAQVEASPATVGAITDGVPITEEVVQAIFDKAKVANQAALLADKAARSLAFEIKLAGAHQAWLRRKMYELTQTSVEPLSETNLEGDSMATNDALTRKRALLAAAQAAARGEEPALAASLPYAASGPTATVASEPAAPTSNDESSSVAALQNEIISEQGMSPDSDAVVSVASAADIQPKVLTYREKLAAFSAQNQSQRRLAPLAAAAPAKALALSAKQRLDTLNNKTSSVSSSLPVPAAIAEVPIMTAAAAATAPVKQPTALVEIPRHEIPVTSAVNSAPKALALTARERLAALSVKTNNPLHEAAFKLQEQPVQAKLVVLPNKPLVADGPPAPSGYPDAAQWSSDITPPGSAYTEQEWIDARTDEDGKSCGVVEIQTSTFSWLNRFTRAVRPTTSSYVNGALVRDASYSGVSNEEFPGLSDLICQCFDGCIWVSPGSTPAMPGAVEPHKPIDSKKPSILGGCVAFGGLRYDVVRPRNDYLLPDRAFAVGTSLSIPFDMDALVKSMRPESQAEQELDAPKP